MGLITDSITYNVRERGRRFTGVDRDLDTAALANLINSPATQEMVKAGDLLGYFGHWPRRVLGMMPQEGGVVDGKVVHVEPALKTVELQALPDGTITHRAQFLDTKPGRMAEGLFNAKEGGFSSAIDPVPRTRPIIPRRFCGFDFVFSPNYNGNRGHAVVLDSVDSEDGLSLLDGIMDAAAYGDAFMAYAYERLQAQHAEALEALERVAADNDRLVSRLARMPRGSSATGVLDGLAADGVPIVGRFDVRVNDHFRKFASENLPPLEQAEKKDPSADPAGDRLLRAARYQFGVPRK